MDDNVPASDYAQATAAYSSHYTDLVAQVGPKLHGSGRADGGVAQLAAIRLLQVEFENIEATLASANAHTLAPIVQYLFQYLSIKGELILIDSIYSAVLSTAIRDDDTLCTLFAQAGRITAFVRLGRLDEARALAEEVIAMAEELQLPLWKLLGIRNLGLADQMQGNYAEAKTHHTAAFELAREIGDRYGEAASLSNLGLVEYSLGHYADSRELYAQALARWRAGGDIYGEASALQNLGNVETLLKDYGRATELYTSALQISERLGNPAGKMSSLIALGFVDHKLGQEEAASQRLRRARSIAQELGDTQLEAVACGNLASVELAQNDLRSAAESLSAALELASRIGNRVMLAYLCIPAADLLSRLGRHGKALQVLECSLNALAALGHSFDEDDKQLVERIREKAQSGAGASGLFEPATAAMCLDECIELVLLELASAPANG